MNAQNSFTLTKRISKHGAQAVIIMPRILQDRLKPGTIAEIRIEILETGRSSQN